ncbi:hypothetical protein [Stutzerimonas stutzeri]|uniref:hypothetical protein n=1 Tax=Stutzerimonas stutzeri TaxID=316 RepID=UPI000F7B6392|nr:hypothetical protein [Stutzerimonas stutzeri]
MAASELTQRCWMIAESLGQPPSASRMAYEAIGDELMNQPIQRHIALSIAGYVSEWRKNGNPFYIDAAFMLLYQVGGTPTETMIAEDAAARAARFNGSPAGTPDSIKNDNAEWSALMLMSNLVFNGVSLRESALKAASYYSIKYPGLKRKKASTLERFYSQKIRKRGVEDDLFRNWRKHSTPEQGAQWREISKAIPECPVDLIGNSRD